jgi:hypothetical protein
MQFLRKPAGVVLAVVLLLATQLAFATEACAAVSMAGHRADATMPMAERGTSSTMGTGKNACCLPAAAPSPHFYFCTAAFARDHGSTAAVGFAGGAPAAATAGVIVIVAGSWPSVRPPAASPGPALPAYIIFRRFLS